MPFESRVRNFKAFWLFFCIAALFLSCKASRGDQGLPTLSSKRRTSFDYFGTVCFISVYDDFSNPEAQVKLDTVWEEIRAMLAELEAVASFDKPDSDIGRFNAAKPGELISISPLTAELLKKAKEAHALTEGAYNPAVADLVDLWGFSPRFRKDRLPAMPYDRPQNQDGGIPLPDKNYIEAFKALADFSLVELGGNANTGFYLIKHARDIELNGYNYSQKIDLGGIAKGWGAEKARELLRRYGYAYGYASLGMSSMSLLKRAVSDEGAPGANMWAVSVAHPDEPSKIALEIFTKDESLSTSGAYDLHYTVEDRRYGHIIDARSGEPAAGEVLSATILGGDAALADALTTALCVMDRKQALGFMKNKLADYRVALIFRGPDLGIEVVTNMASKSYKAARRLDPD